MDRGVQGRDEAGHGRPAQPDAIGQRNDGGRAGRSCPAEAGDLSGIAAGSADAGSPSDPLARIDRCDVRDSGDLLDPPDPVDPFDPVEPLDLVEPTAPLDLVPPQGALARRQRLAELEREITVLAGHLNAAQHRFLKLLAEFDSEEGWNGGGIRSGAHWLNWKCGIDLGAAREKLRVAHALETLPLISAAMAGGELSYSKARALTRVATAQTEADLLMMARHGTAAHVEDIVRGFRRAQDALELTREARQFEGRSVTWFHDDDGSLVLKARLPAEIGALVVRAFEAATADWQAPTRAWSGSDVVWAEAGAEGGVGSRVEGGAEDRERDSTEDRTKDSIDIDTKGDATLVDNVSGEASFSPTIPTTLGQARADALAEMAESFLKVGQASLTGGERQQIVIHVDAATLIGRVPGRCEIEDGPAIAVETARRLSCDASRVTVLEDERGQPLDVGRRTRTIPPAIGRALRARDRGCRVPGCTSKRFLDAHHIRHWVDGGQTRLSNLTLLCHAHHRQVHEGQLRIQRLDDGALVFRSGEGDPIEGCGQLTGCADDLVARHLREGPTLTPETAVTRWAGESLDLGLAVAGLMESWVSERAKEKRRRKEKEKEREKEREKEQGKVKAKTKVKMPPKDNGAAGATPEG